MKWVYQSRLLPIIVGILVTSVTISFVGNRKLAQSNPVSGGMVVIDTSMVTTNQIQGQWKILWQHFLSTDSDLSQTLNQFSSLPEASLPGRWSSITGINRFAGENLGIASYLLKIDTQGKTINGLGLGFTAIPFAYRVFYIDPNHRLIKIGETGIVSNDPSTSGTGRKARSFALPAINNGYLLIEAANFAHSDPRFNTAPLLGPLDDMIQTMNKNVMRHLLIDGINTAIFLIFFCQFFYRQQDRASLCLSFLAAAFIMHNQSLRGYIFSFLDVAPIYTEKIGIPMEYFAIPLGGIGIFGYSYYSGKIQRRTRWAEAIFLVGGILLLIPFLLNTPLLSKVVYFYQGFTFICIVLAIYCEFQRSKESSSAKLSLVAFSILFSSVASDILSTNGIISAPLLTQYASVAFTIFLAQAISIENAETFNHERELSRSLQDEVQRQTSSLRAKTIESRNILRVVTHDIRNPLSVIDGFLQILTLKFQRLSKDQIKTYLQKISRGTGQIQAILEHVREMDAISAGKKQLQLGAVPIKPCLDLLQANFANKLEEKNLKLVIANQVPEDLKVLAEETSLCHNVLANIISNSIKFSPAGSSIDIKVKDRVDEITIEIADHGIGMPREIKEKLFDPFASTTRKGTAGEAGTGFGMPIVKTYMDNYQGIIKVESVTKDEAPKASGTTFSLSFKAAA